MIKINLTENKRRFDAAEYKYLLEKELCKTDQDIYINGTAYFSTNVKIPYSKVSVRVDKRYGDHIIFASISRKENIIIKDKKINIDIFYLVEDGKFCNLSTSSFGMILANIGYPYTYKFEFNHPLIKLINKNNLLDKISDQILDLIIKNPKVKVYKKDLKRFPIALTNKIELVKTFE